jgi:hypothetical protein
MCCSVPLNTPVLLKGGGAYAAVREPNQVILIEEPNEPTAEVSRAASQIVITYSQGDTLFCASGTLPGKTMAYTELRIMASE